MTIHVLMGTNNPGKLRDARLVATQYPGLTIHSPEEVGITIVPDETGSSYTENARIKRDVYLNEMRQLGLSDFFVVSDDSGIEIDALGGMPGIHSRRWKDTVNEMSDAEIINYCLEQLKDVPDEKRTAAFNGVISIGHATKDFAHEFPFRLNGLLLNTVDDPAKYEGYPFRALFYLPEYGQLLHHIQELPYAKRPKGFMSHRELGLKKAFDAIQGVTT